MVSYLAPTPCIIDTDPGVDDVIALLLALSSPNLLVLGITLTHGNTTLDCCTANLQKLFYALEQHLEQHPQLREQWKGVDPEWRKKWGVGPIEVFLGSEGPIAGEAVTAKYFHGRDGLSNCTTRHPDLTPPASHVSPFYTLSTSSALEGATSILSSNPKQSVAYVALGPLTSLAQLHLSSANPSSETSILRDFSVILSMGGALNHPGNTTPVSEYNYYADPYAADVVFKLALPSLFIFPLDTTTYLTLPFELYRRVVDRAFADTKAPSRPEGKTPLAHLTSSFLEGTKEVMASFGGDAMELHDPAVVYALIDWTRSGKKVPAQEGVEEGEFADGWGWKQAAFEVETQGTLTRGMLVQDLRSSSQSTTSLSARTGLTNRTAAVEALDVEEIEAHRAAGEQSREDVERKVRRSGARVVLRSPGSDRLRDDLLKSVWGVNE